MVGVLQRLVNIAGLSEAIVMVALLENYPLGLDRELHADVPLHKDPRPYNKRDESSGKFKELKRENTYTRK